MFSSWETSTFPIWSVSAGVLLGLTVAFSILYELYWSPLSDFPGPKLWAISRIPLQISVVRGTNHLDVYQMFQNYGPVVRISPDELAFGTARSIHDIYGQRPGGCFEKDPSHYFMPPNGAHHVVSTPDHSVHARQRRLLAPAFTERALREQECLIQGYVDTLICKLREEADVEDETSSQQHPVDLRDWLNYTTFDITGDLMFGESFDCLKDTRLHPWIDLLANSIKALSVVGIAAQFPILKTILEALTPSKYTKQAEDHFNLTAEKVDRRLEANISRPDFISAILKNGLSEKKGPYCDGEKIMSRAEIHSNAFILIIAGSETAATCVTGCIYYLCMYPQTLTRLVNEIRSSFESETEMTFRTIATLKYLSAVIEEGLRMYPPLVTSLCRIVPKGGALVDGHYVSEGTKVAFHHYASYRSASNFALPDEFIPDRWLGTDARFNGDSKDVLQPFSYGPRGCLGKGLAYAEIRLILCKLLWHFDITLCPEIKQGNWTDQGVWFFWSKPPLMATLRDRFAEESLSFE
ncbi:hypothetical protein N7481_011548 [Penicillium waksmanii]|uniref:uncharacterized protein n=1 Tax=Penicillium waksmanii TaxID=69791 RepID=UPI0025476825|nr:uncharacterized protein N7481_011548 [Penicillium waksmanii]KAJ5974338.1 hypothetical protein N7481_011548 [Penicillium waksmanii]